MCHNGPGDRGRVELGFMFVFVSLPPITAPPSQPSLTVVGRTSPKHSLKQYVCHNTVILSD